MRTSALAATVLLVAAPLAAQEGDCPLDYNAYEISVPHTDMETCPGSMAVEGAFCRVAVVAEVATVFAFDDETLCIVATRTYEPEEFTLTID